MKVHALIMAAGSGERFAGETPKQLRLLVDRPLVAWSIQRLASSSRIDGIVVVAAPGGEEAMLTSLAGTALDAVGRIVAGGERRQDSVRLGLGAIPDGATHVLIHDAARPCLSGDLLERIVDALSGEDAVVPVAPAVDTLVRTMDGHVDAVIDRANVGHVQTPQAFELGVIRAAHERAHETGLDASDDGTLVLAMGQRVAAVAGEHRNIKVTYPDDLVVAEAILRQGEAT